MNLFLKLIDETSITHLKLIIIINLWVSLCVFIQCQLFDSKTYDLHPEKYFSYYVVWHIILNHFYAILENTYFFQHLSEFCEENIVYAIADLRNGICKYM